MPVPHHSGFLQAGCPSCRPTNSVKALKASCVTLLPINFVVADPLPVCSWWVRLGGDHSPNVAKTARQHVSLAVQPAWIQTEEIV